MSFKGVRVALQDEINCMERFFYLSYHHCIYTSCRPIELVHDRLMSSEYEIFVMNQLQGQPRQSHSYYLLFLLDQS